MTDQVLWTLQTMISAAHEASWVELALKFFPFVLLLELPLFVLVVLGLVRYGLLEHRPNHQREHFPSVSCIITCYAEGEAVRKTIQTLAWQEYPGSIQIIPIIDGALANEATHAAARAVAAEIGTLPRREVMVVPKWQRGGRVSALNTGLAFATGEVVMALDGDTSFDNDMVLQATRHFDDPDVVGVAGCLRVRNAGLGLATRLQALEYMLAISGARTALSQFNLVNNISGAFGVFRAAFIRHLGGWDAGTAEDLDMTLRIKQYFGRHPGLRIVFDPHAVGHTDAPDSFTGFFRQRLRWEGDLFYIFVRKFRYNLRPRLMGWRNFIGIAVTGLLLQLLMPFAILVYTVLMLVVLPVGVVLGLALLIYGVYLAATLLLFGLYLVAVSERPRQDLAFLPWLPLMPVFGFFARLHSAYAILSEVVLKSHLDSAMAPWWVLRKTKF